MRFLGPLLVGLLCLVAIVQAGPALATPTPSPTTSAARVSLRIDAVPPWMGPTSDITATVSVTNNSSSTISGLSLHIEGYASSDSRSKLNGQLAGGSLGSEEWLDSEPFQDTIDPGKTATLHFDLQKPLSAYTYFQRLPSGQVDRPYPVKFTLDVQGTPVAIASTEFIYFQETQVARPMPVGLVIPLTAPSAFDANDRETSRDLEKAIEPGGRISTILDALASPAFAGVSVTVAPTGEFLTSLQLMSGGFTRTAGRGTQQISANDPAAQSAAATLNLLRRLASQPGISLINSPYSGAPLPGLVANGLASDAVEQVQDGQSTIAGILSTQPLPGWLLPADGQVDDATLGALAGAGVANLVLDPSSLQSEPPPNYTPPAEVTAVAAKSQSSASALVADGVLASRLQQAGGESSSQVLQQFLAESAQILEELPNDPPSIVVVTPADWAPDATLIDGILQSLAPAGGSPWMLGESPATLAGIAPRAQVRTVVTSLDGAAAPTPPKDYFDALHSARTRLDDYKQLVPPAQEVDNLTRRLLVAEGEEWWGRGSTPDGAKPYARYVTDFVNREFSKLRVGNQTITLTSSKAAKPLALDSMLTYPVKVVLRLESDKLRFSAGYPCPGAQDNDTMCIPLTLAPGQTTELIPASAGFSGRFPVQVDIQTVSNVTVASGRLTVRSTAYNLLALSIMAAAALFILFSWANGFLRRRAGARKRAPEAEAPPVPPGPLEASH